MPKEDGPMTFAAYVQQVHTQWGERYAAFMRTDAGKILGLNAPIQDSFSLSQDQRSELLGRTLDYFSTPQMVAAQQRAMKELLSTPIGPFTGIKHPERLTPEQIDQLYCPHGF